MNLLPFFYQSSLLYLLEESSNTVELEKIYLTIPKMTYQELIAPSFILRFSSLSFGEFFTLLYEIDKKYPSCIQYYIEQALLKPNLENKLFIHRFYVLIQLRQLKHLFIDSTCQTILNLLNDPLIKIDNLEDIESLMIEKLLNNDLNSILKNNNQSQNSDDLEDILNDNDEEDEATILIEDYNKINKAVGDDETSTFSFIEDMKNLRAYPCLPISYKEPKEIIDLMKELTVIFDEDEDEEEEEKTIVLEEVNTEFSSNTVIQKTIINKTKNLESSDLSFNNLSNFYHLSFQKKKEYAISVDSLNSVLKQYPLSLKD